VAVRTRRSRARCGAGGEGGLVMRRRSLLLAGVLGGPLARPGLAATPVASALPRRALVFPRDHGAHPELRTEWWYVTGQARTPGAGGREFGFQVTFFRTRVDATQAMGSAFAARQLIFAHAALTDVQGRKLWHDQRIAREGFGAAGADVMDGAITLRDWSLTRRPADGAWLARLPCGDFSRWTWCASRRSHRCCKAIRASRERAPSRSRPATTTACPSWPHGAASP
jgi:hypothetical protein